MSYEKTVKLYEECGDDIGEVSYIQHYGSDVMVVNAARVSYGKEIEEIQDKDVDLIKFLLTHKHSTPFEHCGVTFRFVVPLFVSKQHMRSRTWSYNETSRRYTSENLSFYLPQVFRKPHEKDKQASGEEWFHPNMKEYSSQSTNKLIETHTRSSLMLYEAMLSAGVVREMARIVLPQNMYTEYYGTCNLHNLIKFLSLRETWHAQWEIRQVAVAIREILTDLFPTTMSFCPVANG